MTMCAPNFYAQDLTLTYVSAEKYREEQRERLNVQDKLAVADETILALEELLARVTARLKQVESENTKLRTENCILKLGNANKRDTITQPWRVGDHTLHYTLNGICVSIPETMSSC